MDEMMTSGIEAKIGAVESAINSNNFQNAINLLLDVTDFFNEIGDFDNRDKFLVKINNCYKSLAQEFKEHQDYFEAAETLSSAAFLQKEHDKTELAPQLFKEAIDCFLLAGKKAINEQNYLEASRLFSSAANYAKTELQDKTKARDCYQKAIDILQKEVQIHIESEDTTSLCRVQLELGKIYEHAEDYQNAIEQYEKVLKCAKQKELENFIGECFQHMATCHELLGNEQEMIECLNKAVNHRLQEAQKLCEYNLPLEAVQNFIEAANCVSRLNESNDLLKTIIQGEADCFLTVAKSNIKKGKLLQAAYYERNAAYCYNQLGQSETSMDLLLAAAEKLLSINEYQGAANNYQDASLYHQKVGNHLKAANYAQQAAELIKQSGDLETTIDYFSRAAQIYHSIGYPEKAQYCYSNLAECYEKLAEKGLKSSRFHFAAFLFYKAAAYYSRIDLNDKAASCYERAIKYYEKAIHVAIKDKETLLASYSACCATLVCLIMQQPARAEIILNEIRSSSSNNYYQLSDSIIRACKMRDATHYEDILQKFSKIIQNSPEIKNMLDLTKQCL